GRPSRDRKTRLCAASLLVFHAGTNKFRLPLHPALLWTPPFGLLGVRNRLGGFGRHPTRYEVQHVATPISDPGTPGSRPEPRGEAERGSGHPVAPLHRAD